MNNSAANSPVGSIRWQLALLGYTVLGAAMGVGALVSSWLGRPPAWARDP
jgi:hypothetical protein